MAGFCAAVKPSATLSHCLAMMAQAEQRLHSLWPVPDVTALTPEKCKALNDLLYDICHQCQCYADDVESRWVDVAIQRGVACLGRGEIYRGPRPQEPYEPPPQPPWWKRWGEPALRVAAKAAYCRMQAEQDCASVWGIIEIPTPRGPIYIDVHQDCVAAMFAYCMAT